MKIDRHINTYELPTSEKPYRLDIFLQFKTVHARTYFIRLFDKFLKKLGAFKKRGVNK